MGVAPTNIVTMDFNPLKAQKTVGKNVASANTGMPVHASPAMQTVIKRISL